MVFIKLGKTKDATNCINKAIKIYDFRADKIENFVAEETQFPTASKSTISKVLELDPEYTDAKEAKEHITLLIKSIPYIDKSKFE